MSTRKYQITINYSFGELRMVHTDFWIEETEINNVIFDWALGHSEVTINTIKIEEM